MKAGKFFAKAYIWLLLLVLYAPIAFIVIFMNYLADIVTQYVDPRVRLS